MIIGSLADAVGRAIEGAGQSVSEAFFEPTLRLGVTGLSRAGKTVFITSLVANLLDRGRMQGLQAAAAGRIEAAFLQPQPNDTVPRFEYERHRAALLGDAPHWPEGTRQVSQLRLSFRVRPNGLLSGLQGARNVHLDIVDYPGEWLLDLGLLEKDFATWSRETLERAEARTDPSPPAALMQADGTAKFDEMAAGDLAKAWSCYLQDLRAAGYSDCTPGRFLLPGELEGSPALTFAPLPASGTPRGSLAREFARRYEAYKAQVVKPFFRAHFARIDRQVVLVDLLEAVHQGPEALEDLRRAMAGILRAFRPGQNSFLSSLVGQRVERILFAATKADHLHHSQHAAFTALIEALVRDARDRADFAGAQTKALAIAALRATVEETRAHNGAELGMVRGKALASGKEAAFYPGRLPDDPQSFLAGAGQGPGQGAGTWLAEDYAAMQFAPAELSLKPGDGPPHIRLDVAAEFLIGGRL
ncbi:MAG: YcjX family protein [Pseudomonadota bacterium]